MRRDLDIWRPRFVSPFGDWDRFQRQINRLLGDFTEDVRGSGTMRGLEESFLSPACDVEETDDHYLVTVDLPGVDKNDVSVEVQGNTLMISGQKRIERERKSKTRYLQERTQGSFHRSLSLPGDVDADNIEAAYENGELTVVIPKTGKSKSKQIKISGGGLIDKLLSKKDEKKEPGKSTVIQ